MNAYDHFQKYKDELKTKPNLNTALFWASKMSRVGSTIVNSKLTELGYYPELLKLIIEEYDQVMIDNYFKEQKEV